jgi:hypothetical protein
VSEGREQLKTSCHCGALRGLFTPARPLAGLSLRACACSFCSRHRARTVTDPQGQLVLQADAEELLGRYRFGNLRIAEMLICRTCGYYLGAVMEDGGQLFGTLNVNGAEGFTFAQEPARADYQGEGAEERRARRRKSWTPTVLAVGGREP